MYAFPYNFIDLGNNFSEDQKFVHRIEGEDYPLIIGIGERHGWEDV